MDAKRNVHFFDYHVLLFFLLAFVGWLWEVALFLVTDHALINRGVYRGPYLPIYGAGGLLLCLLLRRLRKQPALVFLLSMSICSVLEYFTSSFLEMLWGIRWWDYSSHFLNLHGRICLAGAVIFGLGGALLVCVFLPLYDKWYFRMPKTWRTGLMLGLLAVFVLDATYAAVRPNMGAGISQPGYILNNG
ncbi:MAG: putative ABC transporter permease [Acetatifactor sp.]|nr:putative ABC transporter permease [Acetatifactor sp.]